MKKTLVAILCGIMCLGSTMSVFAQEYHAPTTAEVPITFSKESTFTVTLPESISGATGDTSADFNYTVKGDIASNQTVDLSVEDADSNTDGMQIELKDVLDNKKFAKITLTDSQFASNAITGDDGKSSTGNVSFTGLTAGSWKGNAKFVIALNTTP